MKISSPAIASGNYAADEQKEDLQKQRKMAKGKKSTDDFMIKIGDGDKPKLRRSALTDEKTIEAAVDQVATTGAPKGRKKPAPTKTPAKPRAASPMAQSPVPKAKSAGDKDLEQMLSNKRLTIDIPFYLHDALREHNFRNRSTTKEIINDYLHGLLKVKDIRVKK
jgi:hypothetical protein